ncbi:MAG: hypothetical protein V7780_10010 [Colwellia sp.]|jgi:hypothetical protein|uniref:hypothetical protein n=1 Tax=Colwellia sp. Bg11-12 TaxID=2759817 RepID=UPI0015F7864C|nr:hypothetical protein [Colwellia sp. Bg11-12]MBA6264545.1 hypothetical protein [Colwellia sp. Bg11-12]
MKKLNWMLILLLTGCAAAPVVYNPENTNNKALVHLNTKHDLSMFSTEYSAWIVQMWDSSGQEITKRSAIADDMFGVRLANISFPEGKYKVKALCKLGNTTARPENVFSFESGKKYQLSCVIEKGENMFGMSIDSYAAIAISEL